jgi:hypothetical protein
MKRMGEAMIRPGTFFMPLGATQNRLGSPPEAFGSPPAALGALFLPLGANQNRLGLPLEAFGSPHAALGAFFCRWGRINPFQESTAVGFGTLDQRMRDIPACLIKQTHTKNIRKFKLFINASLKYSKAKPVLKIRKKSILGITQCANS